MTVWQLVDDLVTVACLQLRVHRFGLAHWRAGARLRSWGVAPLHRDGDTLLAPCAADEALWLGAWGGDDAMPAVVRLGDEVRACQASILVPPAFQLTGMQCPDGHDHPLAQLDEGARRDLVLHLQVGRADVSIPLALCAPNDWARMAARPPPAPLAGPPPLPPRLG